jgi:hypothetical protein
VSRSRRMVEAAAAVAVWISIGVAFHLSADGYLLLGIPLTAAFQWGVRRQPLRALWVRDAPAFRMGMGGWGLAGALAVYPGYQLVVSLLARAYGVRTAWLVVAVAGALPAAYALRNFRRATWNALWLCLASAGVIGVLLMVMSAFTSGIGHQALGGRLREAVGSLLLYVPVTFALEEVSFRGAFDSHVYHSGEPNTYATAFFVSALWGLWHIPIVIGQRPLGLLIVGLVGVHCAVGVPLSLMWRRSGNLFVTGFTHAVVDAVRNGLLFV